MVIGGSLAPSLHGHGSNLTVDSLIVSEWRLLSLLAHFSPLPLGNLVIESTSDKTLLIRTLRILEERSFVESSPMPATTRKNSRA